MKKTNRLLGWLTILLFALTLGLAGCEGDDGDQGPPGPPGPPGLPGGDGGDGTTGSILLDWQQSGHANTEGEALRHWDEDGEIPTSCAKCHSLEGFVSFVQDGEVEEAADTEGAISCGACHASTIYDSASGEFDMTAAGAQLEPVTFPSGATATLNGPSNMCMVCHQGRAAGQQVGATVPAGASIVQNAIDADPANLGFINIHYYAASASLFGADVNGGYQYPGNTYVGQFTHVPTRDSCVDCHMGPIPAEGHTFNPRPEYCTGCHAEIDPEAEEPFRAIRLTSMVDFDGDGDTQEGLHGEIQTMEEALLAAIQDYAANTIGTPIVFEGNHPYFFADTNGDGAGDARYEDFDPALLAAAYNYQVSHAEPCGYIHNARYILQLLYDSIEDLGGDVAGLTRPADVGATGIVGEWLQSGHADVTSEAFNHWNDPVADPEGIPAACAKCHSQDGFRDFAEDEEVAAAVPPALNEAGDQVTQEGTLSCGTCHVNDGIIAASNDPTTLWDATEFAALEPVTFPSGATATFNGPSNMCASCHQGRESGVSVQNAIDTADSHRFINRHYFAASAILFGSDVTAAYEYPGQTYLGQNTYPGHGNELSTCVDCHMRSGQADHNFRPQISDCNGCHQTVVDDFELLGLPFGQDEVDYDGDGVGESFQGEIDGMMEGLLAAMQDYAVANSLPALAYSAGNYPYFFVDPNGDGVIDETELETAEGYTGFDDALLPAAFNYHSGQDPCNDMHNYRYTLQTLYDSIDDLDDGELNGSATVNGNAATRPEGGDTQPPAETPAVDAGANQTDVALNQPVSLQATASNFPQGAALTYSWTLEVPDGSTATLTGADTATPSFTPDVAGAYTATVNVSDGTDTATDTVTVTTAGAEVEPPTTVVYENGQGNVTFNHANHATVLNDCMACHTQDPPEPIAIDNTGIAAAHDFCRTCHVAMGAPNACGDCHGN